MLCIKVASSSSYLLRLLLNKSCPSVTISFLEELGLIKLDPALLDLCNQDSNPKKTTK